MNLKRRTGAALLALTMLLASPASAARLLYTGTRGDDVRAVQLQLIDLGYAPGTADGIFGSRTQRAVSAFQQKVGLKADGVVGPKTYDKLEEAAGGSGEGEAPAPDVTPAPTQAPSGGDSSGGSSSSGTYRNLKVGSKGEDVSRVQRQLKALGYFNASVTGGYYSVTRSAVRAFQRDHGLSADGVAGRNTQAKLDSLVTADGTLIGGGSGSNGGGDSNEGGDGPTPAPTPKPTPKPTQKPSANATPYPTLRKGATGDDVLMLQSKLKELGYYTGEVHGTYDSATVTAVKAFQKNNNTGVDGVAGAATLRILYERDPVRADEAPKPVPTVAPGVGEMQGPNPSSVELAHWFDDVKQNYKNGQKLTVYDPSTGLGWKLKIYAMGRHADCEPLTAEDTAIMYKAFGNQNTWTPKPVYVNMPDGRWILATTHNVAHLTGSISDNDFDGHLCVHFYRDMEECQQNDPNYGVTNQKAIRDAWARLHP